MKFFPFSPDHHALFCRGGVVLAPSEKSENNPRDPARDPRRGRASGGEDMARSESEMAELPSNAAMNAFLDDLSRHSKLSRATAAGEEVLVRLVIFGDSWCRCDPLRTWPELFGDHMGWITVNVALPGSDSATLELQARLLGAVLQRTGAKLHPDAWVIVHTGGNDVLRAGPQDLIVAVLRTLCCCCCCIPACSNAHWMLEEVADNIRGLANKLREPPYRVRNLLLVGLPLCTKMPVVHKYLDFLLGVSPMLRRVGRFAVRRLNHLHLARLRNLRAQLGGDAYGNVIALDEAGAIETIVEAAYAARTPAERAAGGGGGAPSRAGEDHVAEEETSDLEEDLDSALWLDMLHPTPRMHWTLSLAMVDAFHEARGLPSLARGRSIECSNPLPCFQASGIGAPNPLEVAERAQPNGTDDTSSHGSDTPTSRLI